MSVRESAMAVFASKAVAGTLAWGIWSLGWPQSWNAHERLALLLQVLTFISLATAVWLRVELSKDSWRRGYRQGREEASAVRDDDRVSGGR